MKNSSESFPGFYFTVCVIVVMFHLPFVIREIRNTRCRYCGEEC